jgi:hypothetical protein
MAHRGGDGNSVAPLQCEAFATAFGGLPAAAEKARQGKARLILGGVRGGTALLCNGSGNDS